jgi:ubiquitin thioesterase protein OTUB1
VSERLPTTAITQEYVNADPVYQLKTAALPDKYPQYRTCQGDGSCGWRAVAFGYFETLIRLGDKSKIEREEIRVRSMENVLRENIPDYNHDLYEDFLDLCLSTFTEILQSDNPDAALFAAFNDSNTSMSIIASFKSYTCGWIRKFQDNYTPYMEVPLDDYLNTQIQATKGEIDHLALTALGDWLCKPIGFGIEVLYLDRSSSLNPSDIDKYFFGYIDNEALIPEGTPTLSLLYRPGHYDILYRPQAVAAPPPPAPTHTDVLVNFQHSQTEQRFAGLPFEVNNFEIPGLATFPGSAPQPYGNFNFLPTASCYAAPTSSFTMSPISPQVQEVYRSNPPPPPPEPASAYHPPTGLSQALGIQESLPFRRSKWEVETYAAWQQGPQAQHNVLSSVFKNSHYNPAHFSNPEFEPEQWLPEADYVATDRSRPGKRSGGNSPDTDHDGVDMKAEH